MTNSYCPDDFLIRFGANLPVVLHQGISVSSVAASERKEVVVHPVFLQRLAMDAELEAAYREILMSVPEAVILAEQKRRSTGNELIACGCYIDENGGMSTWSFSKTLAHARGETGALYEQSTVFDPAGGIRFPDGTEPVPPE